ncbi:D-proline reductase (dithiol) proprotein PrdA [Liquorilactobacillus uvarum]|uniref:D-proline reductase n=1 Tax=Liquorilactobacillus uvarum DSM 19971 TaxID=1423812 RepID=A0A0R1Q5J3_9LACO|nr:D-proline reductase (dithiol) proprotein PrdA [Liquorilactobacillus uvarum]KRL38132.1 D-proline reductase [Liquorilactobacillus uvarum DSM 19971]
MSITQETLKKHMKDPAILCCLTQKGTVIGAEELEDPTIFPDMIESGLMEVTEDGLLIEDVVGKTLADDADALKSITADMLVEPVLPEIENKPVKPVTQKNKTAITDSTIKDNIHLEINELKGLSLDLPAGFSLGQIVDSGSSNETDETIEDIDKGELTHFEYKVNEVKIGHESSFENGVLTVNENKIADSLKIPLVKKVSIDVIKPEERHVYTETIMDVVPIATKVEGVLGEGTSNILKGAVFMLTGIDEAGIQIHEFGSSEGFLDEKMAFDRPGAADEKDIIIRVHVVIEENTGMERRGPFAAHSALDVIMQDVRDSLKKVRETPNATYHYQDIYRKGRPKVVLVKEIMGQGAMHDNVLMPTEPAGVLGGQKNVDLGNVPVVLTPNEVRDGGIHALTCIGPATKEMTRHYFREPLVHALADDEELNLMGVVFIGSPQVNDEKMYVSRRLGRTIGAMDVAGAIVTTEGFGNNHIDFAANIEAIGKQGVPVVGVSFCAYQGQLVVGNQYMDAMVEINKDAEGFENEIAAYSSIAEEDANRAILMLKTKMAGIPIEAPERKWDASIINANQTITNESVE